MKRFSCILVILLFSEGFTADLRAQEQRNFEVVCLGFYNVENLFDTLDSPNTEDAEYTPEGENQWNTKRYQEKLGHLARVISEIGTTVTPDGPALLGIAEVENRSVLGDLVQQPSLQSRQYQIVHHNSPDERGIDVALLYQPKYFTVQSTATYPVTMENKPDFNTRDLLLVNGTLAGESFHILVDHWPSRYGGEKATRPLRIAAAKVVRHVTDSLLKDDPEAKIVLMGDFNDDPVNQSISTTLSTTGKKSKSDNGTLYNPMMPLFKKGVGTLAWNDNWNVFDQIILSPSLVKERYNSFRFYQAQVFNKEYLQQSSGSFKGYPFRTYVGSSYLGGYSDHFPVYIYLVRKKDNR